ncbi:type II toxin-antitoxin system RelE/ParE family toxin [Pontiellaceae bacterium B12227]|nr:type II toxin-antitoxin system RelE/ParE family toxin [Pontiellaceae bacterium B12227]
MILSFKDRRTNQIWDGKASKLDAALQRKAQLKLRYIHLAHEVTDLRVPPDNRLEKLSGDRKGQYSVRMNQQWRICFRWTSNGAEDVEFADYH